MTDRNHTGPDEPPKEYPFIKETIKKRPTDRGAAARKLLLAVFCGILFGICAAVAFVMVLPHARRLLGQEEDSRVPVTLVPSKENGDSSDTDSVSEAVGGTSADTAEAADSENASEGTSEDTDGSSETTADASDPASEAVTGDERFYSNTASAEENENARILLQEKILEASEEPRRALVRVSAVSSDEDLLDDSFLDYGDEPGLVFLKNEERLYIMTVFSQMQEGSSEFRVTFSNGITAAGTLIKGDSRTGVQVLSVSMDSLDEDAVKEISAADLASESDMELMQPVIAIGSPSGDADSVVYGTITSVSGRLEKADESYRVFATDILGSPEGGGFLVDMSGSVTGIIIRQDTDDANVVRVVAAAQLRPLLEVLANGGDIRYIGIYGITITDQQAESLKIPTGVYVDSVEENSPAMIAGIQDGDIIYSLDGQEIRTMEDYTDVLQGLPVNQRRQIKVYRQNSLGEYAEVELNVRIEGK